MSDAAEAPICTHGKDVRSCSECATPDMLLMRKLYLEAHASATLGVQARKKAAEFSTKNRILEQERGELLETLKKAEEALRGTIFEAKRAMDIAGEKFWLRLAPDYYEEKANEFRAVIEKTSGKVPA